MVQVTVGISSVVFSYDSRPAFERKSLVAVSTFVAVENALILISLSLIYCYFYLFVYLFILFCHTQTTLQSIN